jgi:sporulation protein YlmC with PRC-barrel domain
MDRIAIVTVDVEVVAAGVRASRLIGSYVYNDEREDIGSIDDLMIGADDRVEFAILSVGGFLGLGAHLVAVPFDSLETDDAGRVVLPGATREELERLPEFKYR